MALPAEAAAATATVGVAKVGYFIGNFGEFAFEFVNRDCSIAFKGKLISRHEHVPIRCTDELNENGSKELWINVTLISN